MMDYQFSSNANVPPELFDQFVGIATITGLDDAKTQTVYDIAKLPIQIANKALDIVISNNDGIKIINFPILKVIEIISDDRFSKSCCAPKSRQIAWYRSRFELSPITLKNCSTRQEKILKGCYGTSQIFFSSCEEYLISTMFTGFLFYDLSTGQQHYINVNDLEYNFMIEKKNYDIPKSKNSHIWFPIYQSNEGPSYFFLIEKKGHVMFRNSKASGLIDLSSGKVKVYKMDSDFCQISYIPDEDCFVVIYYDGVSVIMSKYNLSGNEIES